MLPNEYQQKCLRTKVSQRVYDDFPSRFESKELNAQLLHGVIGICTESGELIDQLKKCLIYKKQLDEVNILEECGDLLWYISIALDSCGYTMEDAMKKNLSKLLVRFPDKYQDENALNRNLNKERCVLESDE